jgi:hypothetical protein
VPVGLRSLDCLVFFIANGAGSIGPECYHSSYTDHWPSLPGARRAMPCQRSVHSSLVPIGHECVACQEVRES